MAAKSIEGVAWAEAWARASRTLDGVERRQMVGARREISLGLLGRARRAAPRQWLLRGDSGAGRPCVARSLRGALDRCRKAWRLGPDSTGDDGAVYGWERLASDLTSAVRQILDETGQRSVRLGIGHSFGGALMLRAAAREPSSFEQLLLCDLVILPPMTPAERAANPGGSRLAERTRRRRDHFPSREAAFDHFRSRGVFADFTPEALAIYVAEGLYETSTGEVALKCAREVEAAIFDGGARAPAIEDLEKVTAEVLFAHALRGNFSKSFYDRVAGQIERARVESHDVGHLFPLEAPARVLSIVKEMTR